MTIIASTNNVQNPAFKLTNWLPSLNTINRNISSIALPIIAIGVLLSLPVARADNFTECMNGCDDVPEGLPRLLCQTGCFVIDVFKR